MAFVTADKISLENNLIQLIEGQLEVYLLSFEKIDGFFILVDRKKRFRTATFHVEKDYIDSLPESKRDNFTKLPQSFLKHVKDALLDRIDTFFGCLLNDTNARVHLTSHIYIRLNNCISESGSKDNWLDLIISVENRKIEKIFLPKPHISSDDLNTRRASQIDFEKELNSDYDDIVVLENAPKKIDMIFISDEDSELNDSRKVCSTPTNNEF